MGAKARFLKQKLFAQYAGGIINGLPGFVDHAAQMQKAVQHTVIDFQFMGRSGFIQDLFQCGDEMKTLRGVVEQSGNAT